jgi:NAD+ kinase
MIVKKLHFVTDNTYKANQFKKKIHKKYKNFSPKKSDVIVVLGGDGFMLQTLKKYQKYNKPFYGMNLGTFGFLMNKFKRQNIEKAISKSKLVSISPLEAKILNKKNKVLLAFAINEISLLRQSRQTASLQIINAKKVIIKKLISDGVLISTPAGSTAYNLSVHGPILSINSKKLAVTPISPFRPRRWKGKILTSSKSIKIINLDIKKRPVSVVADNLEFRNVRNVIIKTKNSMKFKLLYDKNNDLNKKIKLEQIRKQTD